MNEQWKPAPWELAGLLHGTIEGVTTILRREYPEDRFDLVVKASEDEAGWCQFEVKERKP